MLDKMLAYKISLMCFFINIFLLLELKLDIKDQLIMSLEGNTICKTDQKYTADIIFICDETVSIKDK